MTKHQKNPNPQAQNSQPPQDDEVAMQKAKAQEQEVAGRHKNDGQNDNQPGKNRGRS